VLDSEEFVRDLLGTICFYRQTSLADHQERPAAVAEALSLILQQETAAYKAFQRAPMSVKREARSTIGRTASAFLQLVMHCLCWQSRLPLPDRCLTSPDRRAAASIFLVGRGDSPGYVRAWRATVYGLEGAAASASDTVLILVELGVADARDAAGVLYSLSNGTGKARAARDGSLREPKSWRVLFLSTGEVPTETKLAEERGRKARAGQLVRMLEIPADRGLGFGAFDHGGAGDDASTLAKTFKRAAISAYGTAGPEFVRRLISEEVTDDDVRALVADFVQANVPAGSDGQIDRAAQRLGLIAVAGELATAVGIVPWRQGEATAAAAWALGKWIDGRGGTEPAEVRQAIEQVRFFIEQHGESRFVPLDNPDVRPVNNRAGWRRGVGSEREWLIPPQVWKAETCSGVDAKMVARILAERGLLVRASDGFQSVRRIDGEPHRVYVLTAKIFEGGDEG
jgi:putative DNA primase/helicase